MARGGGGALSWWRDVVEVLAGGVRLWRLELGGGLSWVVEACASGERRWRFELVARGGGGLSWWRDVVEA